MVEQERLLVIAHPVLGKIEDDDIEQALPISQRSAGWERVDVTPVEARLATLHELDWKAALDAQERLFAEQVEPRLQGRSRLAYFGFAPIPLALHLGYRLERGRRIDVYQRHHERMDWAWMPEDEAAGLPAMKPVRLPDHGTSDRGPVVIRVSTSHAVGGGETAEVVPGSLADVDVALVQPHEDALSTPGALTEVVKDFNRALAGLRNLCPRLTAIHVFASVPVGMALRLGTQINPTIYPDVVTYQYRRQDQPRYKEAIVLTGGRGVVRSGSVGTAVTSLAGSSWLLTQDEIHELHQAAVSADLADKHEALLTSLDKSLRSQLPFASAPADLMLMGLDMLNRLGVLRDGSVPLIVWLKNALLLTRPRSQALVFEKVLAKLLSAGTPVG